MIYVIADDLTGANDTGVQFSKRGLNTVVFILTESADIDVDGAMRRQAEVLVVDTETREVDAAMARTKIRSVLHKLKLDQKDIIYKKIDSTLRGSIGAEIEEIMLTLQKNICIFTPSFPSHRRITVGGYLIVKDDLPSLREYSGAMPGKNHSVFIPALLERQTGFPVARIGLEDVVMGPDIISDRLRRQLAGTERIIVVVDAAEESHLKNIVTSALDFEGSVLLCGSAGSAKHLSDCLYLRKRESAGPVLLVCGSRSPIMQVQINYLHSAADIFEINVDLQQIFAAEEEVLHCYFTQAAGILEGGQNLVIRPDVKYHPKKAVETIMAKHGVSFREVELAIRGFLGRLTAKIMDRYPLKNIILVGGDIAVGVCLALQIQSLRILDELLPGVPISVGESTKFSGLRIVTKAGAFGEEDTLYKMLTGLLNYQRLGVEHV